MKYVSFPWLPVEAALSIFNFSPFVKNTFFYRIIDKREIALNA
jgi:hypothetical protein